MQDQEDILDFLRFEEPEDDLTEEELRERESDPALGRHSGICRACGNYSNSVSNDDGYGSCCN